MVESDPRKAHLAFLLKSFRDMQGKAAYCDSRLVCADGTARMNRMLLEFCLPEIRGIRPDDVESGDICILLPHLSLQSLLSNLETVLSLFEEEVEESECLVELVDGEEEKDRNYLCDVCSFAARSQGNLQQHKNSKHSRLRLRCALCSYITTTKINLKRHQTTVHLGERYQCNQCDKSFTTFGNLKQHTNVKHKNIKYACDLCSFAGATKSSLSRHIKAMHENVRFSCEYCSHKATSKWNMKVHIDTVHLNSRYQCDQCLYLATTRGHLATHIKSCHS